MFMLLVMYFHDHRHVVSLLLCRKALGGMISHRGPLARAELRPNCRKLTTAANVSSRLNAATRGDASHGQRLTALRLLLFFSAFITRLLSTVLLLAFDGMNSK